MIAVARVAVVALLAGCASNATQRLPAPRDATVDASEQVSDPDVADATAASAGHDAMIAPDGSAGTGGAVANDSGSLPQRMEHTVSIDSDVLGDKPSDVLARVAGTYHFELAAPLGQVSITVPESATTATLVTIGLNRFIEVPLNAEIAIGADVTLSGGKLLVNGTPRGVFEVHFDAGLLPSDFFTNHPEASACADARIVIGWDGASLDQASLQLLKPKARPDDRIDVCYVEIGTALAAF